MGTYEFYEKWKRGLLPEPLDPETHSDFVIWYGIAEELLRIEAQLGIRSQPQRGRGHAGKTSR